MTVSQKTSGTSAPISKIEQVLTLLHRDEGATGGDCRAYRLAVAYGARGPDRASQERTRHHQRQAGRRDLLPHCRAGLMARHSNRLGADLAALETMSSALLQQRWLAIGEGVSPSVPSALLRRLLAQRLQERRHGVLPVMVARELERLAEGPSMPAPAVQRPALTHGTRLIREWNGQTISVEVVEGGFVWNGRHYRSLSDIAKAVTGAHWSGPRFFGLRRRG